jgi:hypothetical protein
MIWALAEATVGVNPSKGIEEERLQDHDRPVGSSCLQLNLRRPSRGTGSA